MTTETTQTAGTPAVTVVQIPDGDIRHTHAEEIRMAVVKFASHHGWELQMLAVEKDDFVQDVLLNIYRRQGLNHYEDGKVHGGLEPLIYLFAKNALIDIKRSKYGAKTRQNVDGSPIRTVSMQDLIAQRGAEEFALEDVLASDPDTAMLLMELMDGIPNTQISPNYRLTWKELFVKMMRYKATVNDAGEEVGDPDDRIAREVGISTSRIKQLEKELFHKHCKPLLKTGRKSSSYHQVVEVGAN